MVQTSAAARRWCGPSGSPARRGESGQTERAPGVVGVEETGRLLGRDGAGAVRAAGGPRLKVAGARSCPGIDRIAWVPGSSKGGTAAGTAAANVTHPTDLVSRHERHRDRLPGIVPDACPTTK